MCHTCRSSLGGAALVATHSQIRSCVNLTSREGLTKYSFFLPFFLMTQLLVTLTLIMLTLTHESVLTHILTHFLPATGQTPLLLTRSTLSGYINLLQVVNQWHGTSARHYVIKDTGAADINFFFSTKT